MAVNEAGNSEYTEELTVTVGVVPNAPTNLAIKGWDSQTSVEFEWDADVAIASNVATTAYRVYLDDQTGNAKQLVYDTANFSFTNKAVLNNLVIGYQYLVTVRSVNAIGESVDSTAFTLNVGTVPSKVDPVILVSSTTTSIKVQWKPPTTNGGLPLTKYKVYLDVGQTGSTTAT